LSQELWRKCSLHKKIHYSKGIKAIDVVLAENLDYTGIILHEYGKLNYMWFRKVSKFTVLFWILTKNRVKNERLNHLPSIFYDDYYWECSQMSLKESFLRYLSDKMQKNIESQAKYEGFGWLKHEILHFVRRLLVFLLAGVGARARALFSAIDLAGASFDCCPSKVVSRLINHIMKWW